MHPVIEEIIESFVKGLNRQVLQLRQNVFVLGHVNFLKKFTAAPACKRIKA
jgi:hypothetical protein